MMLKLSWMVGAELSSKAISVDILDLAKAIVSAENRSAMTSIAHRDMAAPSVVASVRSFGTRR